MNGMKVNSQFVIDTPWGRSDQLRARRLSTGPRQHTDAEVADNHRERLFAATAATVAELGYAHTRVADIVNLAGVSRTGFYRLFTGKEDVFEQMLEAAVAALLDRIEDSWAITHQVHMLDELVDDYPELARVCLEEIHEVSPQLVERALCAAAVKVASRGQREGAHLGPNEALAIVGAIARIYVAKAQGRLGYDTGWAALRWAMAIKLGPGTSGSSRSRPVDASLLDAHDDLRGRVIAAVTRAVAKHGYQRTTIVQIAAEGRMSLSSFYRCFETKHDAFVAALENAGRLASAATSAAYESDDEWAPAAAAGIRALLEFLAGEPEIARILVVDALAAGPEARRHADIAAIAFDQASTVQDVDDQALAPIAYSEASAGAIHALAWSRIVSRGSQGIDDLAPSMILAAIAPVEGPLEARKLAIGVRAPELEEVAA